MRVVRKLLRPAAILMEVPVPLARHALLGLVVVFAISLASAVSAAPLHLASDGVTRYTIVVDPGATASERHAARELADFLKQTTGADFPITTTVETPTTARRLLTTRPPSGR